MNTKLSITLLSGLSLFLSIGAFAVSDEPASDYLNWSYAMGDSAPTPTQKQGPSALKSATSLSGSQGDSRDCTVGCPGRVQTDDVEPLTLTYEDEAAPVIERTEPFSEKDRFVAPVGSLKTARDTIAQERGLPVSQRMPEEKTIINTSIPPMVDTQYVQSPPKVQYPITRQYPISVQYPVTVQRNMTVEQPVVMQQPVIVRRPVVMQQEITVQRQPTIVQQQPVIMQQQPTFVQQQPVMIQAPAQPINPAVLSSLGYLQQPQLPPQAVQQLPTWDATQSTQQQIPPTPQSLQQPAPQVMPYTTLQPVLQQPIQQPIPVGIVPQQYYVQGQVMAQPVYAQQPYAPAPQPTEPAQQATYPNTTY